jgi:hypothetical protein
MITNIAYEKKKKKKKKNKKSQSALTSVHKPISACIKRCPKELCR